MDAKWVLHELPNGTADSAIKLCRAGELLDCIDYPQRDSIGKACGRLWLR